MTTILFYSNNCKYCKILQDYKSYDYIKKFCVDNKNYRNKIPEFIKSVPALMIKHNNDITIYMENDLHQWFQEQDKSIENNNQNNNQNINQTNSNSEDYQNMKKSTKNENEMLDASNELIGGFSSGYSFMDDNENSKIDGGSYSSLDNINSITTLSDETTLQSDRGGSKDISSKYEELMKERDSEFKGIARLG